MKTIGIILGAALFLAGPATAAPSAKAVAAAQRTLDGWFSGYEFVPRPEHYKRLGEALPYALLALATDPEQDLLKRARAMSSLVYAPSPAVEAVLVQLAEDAEQPSVLRRKALAALADVYAERHVDLAVSVWATSPDDVLLREACARALRTMGPPAYPAREALLHREKAPTVRALLNEDLNLEVPR